MTDTDTAFSKALRTSIARSGLSLDRLQARLRANGIPVSITALSYWQSGKRQPERQSSLSAVRVLEDVLGLRPGELLSLLPPPRPRGTNRPRGEPVNFPVDALRTLLERVGAPHALEQQHKLKLASLHDRCEIAADGGQRATTARAVFQATADGQDRWLLVYDHGGTDAGPPRLHALRNCRAGRVEVDTEHGLTAAELLFDRTLERGETQLIEYTLTNGGPPYPPCSNTYYREFRRPVREYLLEISFDTAPERCWQYTRTDPEKGEERRDLHLDTTGGVHAVALDFGPGVFGIGWT
ncbi:hypothetical protein [Amycolatopsis sacchari]|uniref:Uncharacterized protein n=1 Tax=Amycolatopsis sacchari TaxID=115433 RepID=A0A1I3M3R6_9PSEU|nr:hypothetical protein [Amycolatopsis sacchari]SFI91664.1 hypothetical protein SAMN05421835_102168 [Amycolatopsis sacchari]